MNAPISRPSSTLLLLAGLAAPVGALAEAPDPAGEARLSVEHTSPVPLGEGAEAPDRTWLASRLRAGGTWRSSDRLAWALEVEALTGYLAGETTELGLARGGDTFLIARDGRRDLTRVLPRKAQLAAGSPRATLLVGADTFAAGLGLLANDGAQERPFGDPWRGNVVARVGGRFAPWLAREQSRVRGLGFLVAADLVLRDENAEVWAGDLAGQAVVGARWVLARGWVSGFGSLRLQQDREDPLDPRWQPTLAVAAPLDLSFSLPVTPEAWDTVVWMEAEAATVQGWTDRPYTPATVEGGARVASLGALARARVEHPDSGLSASLEGGYASGDNDVRDDVARTFRFHSDLDVGLVLFEHALPLLGAAAVDRLADPGLVAVPPPGTRALVPQGVEGAVYAFPVLAWTHPGTGLGMRLGAVIAAGSADVQDPYLTAISGGYNTSWSGEQPGSRALGSEVDAGLRWSRALGGLRLEAAAEAGAWSPGAAFDGVIDEACWAGRGRLGVRW